MTHMGMITCLMMQVNECTCVGASQSPARAKMDLNRFLLRMHDKEQGANSCIFCEFMQNHDAHEHDYMPNNTCQ